MIKTGQNKASVFCRSFVGVCAVFLTGASMAAAGAWEEFERRCLVPMENVADPVISSLQFLENEGDFGAWVSSEGWSLGHRSSREGDICRLNDLDWSDGESEQLMQWVRQSVPSGRYKALAPAYFGAPMVFRSTNWREPRIEITVHLTKTGSGVTLAVEETDLES